MTEAPTAPAPQTDKRRWLLKITNVTKEEAEERKMLDVEHCVARLKEAKEELSRAMEAPLLTESTDYIPVEPGHPEYDKAEIACDSREFRGTWQFINTEILNTTSDLCQK